MTAVLPDEGAAAPRYTTRTAQLVDASAITAIYNQGIADRIATFETEPRSPEDIAAWFTSGRLIMVAENGGAVVAFAASFPYSTRPCYAGVNEFSVYVAREDRRCIDRLCGTRRVTRCRGAVVRRCGGHTSRGSSARCAQPKA